MSEPFLARESELARLEAACARVASGEGPMAIEVVGERGAGKTRLMQELYARLAADTAWNPAEASYWPSKLDDNATRQGTNPELRKAASARGAARFLWIGVRAHAPHPKLPDEPEASSTELLRELELHARRGQRFGGIGAAIALALAQEGEMDSGVRERASAGLRASLQACEQGFVLLWIDDAHWASPTLLELVQRSWSAALEHRTRLLLVLGLDSSEPSFARASSPLSVPQAQRIELARVAERDLRSMLVARLPGLLPHQQELFLAASNGNFLRLSERIAWISLLRGNFEFAERHRALNASGEAELRAWDEGRRDRVQVATLRLGEAVKRLLGWSSELSWEFLDVASNEYGRRMALAGASEADLASREQPVDALPADPRVEHGRGEVAFHLEARKLWHCCGEREVELLSATLRDVCQLWINESFGPDGNWKPHDATDLSTLPRRSVLALLAADRTAELRDLLDIAMAELALPEAPDWTNPEHVAALRAIRTAVQNDAEELLWPRTRRCAERLSRVNWSDVPESVIGSAGREALARRVTEAGIPKLARDIRASRVELLRSRAAEQRESAAGIDELADALSDLGQSLWELGDNPGAERAFGEQLALMRARVEGDTGSARRRNLSIALDNVAGLAATRGQLDFARSVYRESLAIARELVLQDDSSGARRDLFLSISNVATIEYRRGKLEEALSMHEESLVIRRALADELGTDDARHDLENGLECVADIEHELGRFESAAQKYEECLAIERELAERLGTTAHRWSVAQLLRSIADIERNSGRRGSAMRRLEESLTIARAIASELATPASRREVAAVLRAVGTLHEERNDLVRAREAYAEALELARTNQSDGEDSTAGSSGYAHLLCDIADVDLARGEVEVARRGYEQALAIHRRLAEQVGTPDCRRDLLVVLDHLANLDERQGLTDSALARFREIADGMRALADELGTPTARRDHSVALLRIADALRARGRLRESLELYEQCLAVRAETLERLEDSVDANLSFVTDWHATLRIVRDLARECGELDRARTLARDLVEMAWPDDEDADEDFGPAQQEDLLVELLALAGIELERGDSPSAAEALQRARQLAASLEEAFDDPAVNRAAEALDATTLERCAITWDLLARLSAPDAASPDPTAAHLAQSRAADLRARAQHLPPP
jgi:tetratricopeptide (TPR) repeat protein